MLLRPRFDPLWLVASGRLRFIGPLPLPRRCTGIRSFRRAGTSPWPGAQRPTSLATATGTQCGVLLALAAPAASAAAIVAMVVLMVTVNQTTVQALARAKNEPLDRPVDKYAHAHMTTDRFATCTYSSGFYSHSPGEPNRLCHNIKIADPCGVQRRDGPVPVSARREGVSSLAHCSC